MRDTGFRETVRNAGHFLASDQCVRDTGQGVEMRDCPAECGTGRNFFSVSGKTDPYRENQSLSGKPILIRKTNPYRENHS